MESWSTNWNTCLCFSPSSSPILYRVWEKSGAEGTQTPPVSLKADKNQKSKSQKEKGESSTSDKNQKSKSQKEKGESSTSDKNQQSQDLEAESSITLDPKSLEKNFAEVLSIKGEDQIWDDDFAGTPLRLSLKKLLECDLEIVVF